MELPRVPFHSNLGLKQWQTLLIIAMVLVASVGKLNHILKKNKIGIFIKILKT